MVVNKVLKYSLGAIFAAAAVIFMAAMLAVSDGQRKALKCSGISVVIADSTERSFVTAKEVTGYLDKEFSGYKGMPVKDLNTARAERIIDSKSAVLKSQVFVTRDGMLNVTVTQREPAVRFQNGDTGFYADTEGCIFPLQSNYTARVPIINGNIPIKNSAGFKGKPETPEEMEWMRGVLDMVAFMNREKTWAENIVQISIGRDGDMVMVPRNGKEKFIFGGPERYAEKFGLMEKYYTAIVPEKGADFYSTVNVKYRNQIICRK